MNNELLFSILKVIFCFIIGMILGRLIGCITIKPYKRYYDAMQMNIKLIYDQCNDIKYISLNNYKKIFYFDTWQDVLKYIRKHQKRCKGKVFLININTKPHYFMIIDKYNIEEVLLTEDLDETEDLKTLHDNTITADIIDNASANIKYSKDEEINDFLDKE